MPRGYQPGEPALCNKAGKNYQQRATERNGQRLTTKGQNS
jgi:hypothetical protein